MSSKQIKISDTFELSNCGVCGCSEINQYFTINDNFIEYSGTFLSLKEILKEALDLRVSKHRIAYNSFLSFSLILGGSQIT